MSKSTFIIGRLQTACAVECPLPGIRVAGGEDSFALNLVHERNNEEPEEDNGIFKLVTLAR